ncbi:MAG: OmpH family outer membrane protein [Flavobacteriales bacterium]|nr:OmpH family outer membrane protein [Flavobacteriales bacterium]
MKNLSLALNAVLTIAVIILFYLHFSGQPSTETAETAQETEVAETAVSEEPPARDMTGAIGYINVDSLQTNYKLYKELIDQLKARESRYEKELNAKSAALEKKFIEFQKAAPTMTQFEGQTKQKELMEEEQKLYKMRDEFAVKFQEEEAKLNEKFQKKVKDFIKNFNQEKGFDIVIGASRLGNVVLDYNETIDISNDVISGLNKLYDEENAPAAPKENK